MEAAKNTENQNIEPIRVVVRCRPLVSKEIQDQRESIVTVNENPREISVIHPKPSNSEEGPKNFYSDHVFGPETSQDILYNEIASPIVDSVLQGGNGTIFAYGQTGAGKTYTMQGYINSEETKGITPRVFEQLFNHIESTPDKQFVVRVSFLEIYNEQILDLLNREQKSPLQIRQKPDSGVYVENLLSLPVGNVAEAYEKLATGNKNQAIRLTMMSTASSRSHTIFSITVESSEAGLEGESILKVGKLNLVDLAGSERSKKAGTSGERLKEGSHINMSLAAFGNVISALANPKTRHVPYRDSKLTRLLQESLEGNAKTVMIANIGPADWNYDETISTLRFANRTRMIRNNQRTNEELNYANLRVSQEGIEKIKIQKEGSEHKKQSLEDKKEMIEAQKELTDAEKQRLLADLVSKEEEQKVENDKKISSQQQEEMESLKKKLEEKSVIEQKLIQKLDEKEAELQSFRTMYDELEEKNKIIEKLVHELRQAKTDIQELHEGFCGERKVYQGQIDDLSSQLKLKDSHSDQNSSSKL